MEGAPKSHTQEAANRNEAPANLESMTPEQVQEKIAESVEKAEGFIKELKQLDRTDEEGNSIALNKEEWEEAGVISAELKETLFYIPVAECLQNGLPYHPTDEKYEWPKAALPDQRDYPLSYEHDPEITDGVEVDQVAEVAPGVLRHAA